MGKFTKVETMSVREFMSGRKTEAKPEEAWSAKVARHFEKYGMVYKIAGSTVVILMAGGGFDYAFAASTIDTGAEKLYGKLMNIGKWIIIFKGGFDIVKHLLSGDFDGAKKGFLQYLVVYLFLLGLPWAMSEVDAIFVDLKTT